MELYALRRDAYDSAIVKDLIRHGVLIPVSVKVEAADGDTGGTRVRVEGVDEDESGGVESEFVGTATEPVQWGGHT